MFYPHRALPRGDKCPGIIFLACTSLSQTIPLYLSVHEGLIRVSPPFPQSSKGWTLPCWGWTTRALPGWWSSAWPHCSWCPTSRDGDSAAPPPWAATPCRCSRKRFALLHFLWNTCLTKWAEMSCVSHGCQSREGRMAGAADRAFFCSLSFLRNHH